jgi:hypothetical protein
VAAASLGSIAQAARQRREDGNADGRELLAATRNESDTAEVITQVLFWKAS